MHTFEMIRCGRERKMQVGKRHNAPPCTAASSSFRNPLPHALSAADVSAGPLDQACTELPMNRSVCAGLLLDILQDGSVQCAVLYSSEVGKLAQGFACTSAKGFALTGG
jgi:hypothetical protein